MEAPGRNSIIDAYRGLAILAVMAFHYTVEWPEMHAGGAGYSDVFQVGRYGVHLFFVISGLVITMTVLRSATSLEFGVRRFARLYPAFVTSLFITFLLMQWGPPEFQRSWSDLAANLTMDAPAFGKRYIDGAYWSLAVEVKFYFYVFLARALLGEKFWIGILIVAFASLLPLGDTWAYSANRPWWPYFLLGIGGWYAIFEKRVRVAATLGIASVVLYCVVRPAGYLPEDWLVHAFIWGAASSMLLLLWKAPSWSPPPVRWMARVGSISYSLYLLHQYIGVTIISMITDRGFPDLLAIAVAASAVCCIAYVSFEYVEKPGNRALMRVFRAVFSGGEPPAKGNGSVTSATDMELPARANVTSATVEPAGAPLAEFAVARCDRSTRPSLS